MIAQPSLFDQPSPCIVRGWSIDADFRRFHELNPHVYREIVRIARDAKAGGRKWLSMKWIFEELRKSRMSTIGEPFKLNNSYTSFYSRLVTDNELDLVGFFRQRTQRAG